MEAYRSVGNNSKSYNYNKARKIRRIVITIFIAIQIIVASCLFAKLQSIEIVPIKYQVVIGIAIVFFNTVAWFSVRKKHLTVLMSIVSTIITVVIVIALVAVFKMDSGMSTIFDKMGFKQTVEMAIVVRADDPANTITDISGYNVGFVPDDKLVVRFRSEVLKEVNNNAQFFDYNNFMMMSNGLLNGSVNAMLINTDNLKLLDKMEGFNGFNDKVKVIYKNKITLSSKPEKIDVKTDKFVIYISGSDSRGETGIELASRSDTNILAVVNVKTGKVQLISTPRDYYVKTAISGEQRDKLTHAGNSGIEVSVKTLEMLYGVKIDYYFKINFEGFKTIIDQLGGIDVYSDMYFWDIYGHEYQQGMNHLDGETALCYSRERDAFKKVQGGGDSVRARHQMDVIKAVMEKMMSKEFLKKYDRIMSSLASNIATTIPKELMYSLINNQLENMPSWDIQTHSVVGGGYRKTTFSAPNSEAWVQVPLQGEVDGVMRKINETLGEFVAKESSEGIYLTDDTQASNSQATDIQTTNTQAANTQAANTQQGNVLNNNGG